MLIALTTKTRFAIYINASAGIHYIVLYGLSIYSRLYYYVILLY